MCILSGPINDVKSTQIFATLLTDDDNHRQQFTCYRNTVELDNDKPVAMLLPFPNPTESPDTIKLFDMTLYEHFFDDLEKAFPKPLTKGAARSAKSLEADDDDPIAIQQCGPYEYSIAPTLTDLTHIQWQHFKIWPEVRAIMQTHYAHGWGFLVCLCTKSGSHSPLGVIHPALSSGDIYVPTMHAHIHNDWTLTDGKQLTAFGDWDHTIYILNTVNGSRKMSTSTGGSLHLKNHRGADRHPNIVLDYGKLPLGFPYLVEDNLHYFNRYTIEGRQDNGDLYFLDAASFVAKRWTQCSRTITGNMHVYQPWYVCRTCHGHNEGKGLCPHCSVPHARAGHVVEPHDDSRSPYFFCDAHTLPSIL